MSDTRITGGEVAIKSIVRNGVAIESIVRDGVAIKSIVRDGVAIKSMDQRREPRRPAQGTVRIRRADSVLPEIVGKLIDISTSGFRASHSCTTLASGEIVGFSQAFGEGDARVVWTRVLAGGANPSVESGFVLLAEA